MGARCFIVKLDKLYGQKRALRTQHMTLTLEKPRSNGAKETPGLKFAKPIAGAACRRGELVR